MIESTVLAACGGSGCAFYYACWRGASEYDAYVERQAVVMPFHDDFRCQRLGIGVSHRVY